MRRLQSPNRLPSYLRSRRGEKARFVPLDQPDSAAAAPVMLLRPVARRTISGHLPPQESKWI